MTNPMKPDPRLNAKLVKAARHDSWIDHAFRRILRWVERAIAVITVIGLVFALGIEVYRMFTEAGYFRDVIHLLHNLLSIVVGLEFVRMLLDTTPANILEVLTLAITRYVVLSHDNAWTNVLSILCIAALFAIRRFLIRPEELDEEIVEDEP